MSGGTHLTLDERERLAALKAEGLGLRAIARELGRAASTVSRELRRNALPKGGYLPVHAEGCYLERRQRSAILERDERLGRFVRERLLEGWTPEQIAGWLKRGEECSLRTVATETIYAFLHRAGQKGEKLWKLLPRGRAKRARRRARQPRSTIAERRSIHDRPAEVQERKEAGHWEGDLLICKRTRPVLVLKERKTRFVLAARLAGKSAAETVAIMMAVFRRLDPRLRSSITFDNDTAFARHGLLASVCAMATWFCDAYASWQKGAVENANGRLRRDLPRDLDLDALGDAELQEIVLIPAAGSLDLWRRPASWLGRGSELGAGPWSPCRSRRGGRPRSCARWRAASGTGGSARACWRSPTPWTG
jgi:IS30 family transposase